MAVLLRAAELAPIQSVLDTVGTQRGRAAVHGLAPGLVVEDPTGWVPAAQFTDGSALPGLIAMAEARWGAGPATAAALAWKSYAYWVTLPAALGYAVGRVPDLSAGNVLVKLHGIPPFVEIGLRGGHVETGSDLAGYLRRTLLDGHLDPVLDGLHRRVRLGRRTLLGSLASAVAYSLTRAADALPGPVGPTAATLLAALGVADLVEITPDLRVQRKTCCLAFTLPQPKICSGCCVPQLP